MRACLALLLLSVSSVALGAEAYPNKPIRMILPVAPSGGSDITARTMNPKLIEYLGQQVIIDNRPGAGGTNGMVLAARAAPDGYTVIQSTIGPTAVNVTLEKNLPYDTLRDFTPIARGVSMRPRLVRTAASRPAARSKPTTSVSSASVARSPAPRTNP